MLELEKQSIPKYSIHERYGYGKISGLKWTVMYGGYGEMAEKVIE